MGKQGFVYVAVQQDRPGHCKVGKTSDPAVREKNLGGSALAVKIDIVDSVRVKDMDAVEDAFHKIFSRTNRSGEWFNIEPERVLPMLRCLGGTQARGAGVSELGQAPPNPTEATSDLPGKTPQAEFCKLIVDVLKELGGSAHAKEVTAKIGERVQLRPRDLEQYKSGQVVWKNSVAWARNKLRDDGVLKPHSPRGSWELAAPSSKAGSRKKREPGQTRRSSGRTPASEFRQSIVDVLKELGGKGRAKDVTAGVGEKVHLRPSDLERLGNGQVVWEHAVAWARVRLVKQGTLKSDSPRGMWELA